MDPSQPKPFLTLPAIFRTRFSLNQTDWRCHTLCLSVCICRAEKRIEKKMTPTPQPPYPFNHHLQPLLTITKMHVPLLHTHHHSLPFVGGQSYKIKNNPLGLLGKSTRTEVKWYIKMMESGVPVCNSCGEQVGINANGELFVACHECNFSICKACVDLEIKEGRKLCLRCGAPYDGIVSLTSNFLIKFMFFG